MWDWEDVVTLLTVCVTIIVVMITITLGITTGNRNADDKRQAVQVAEAEERARIVEAKVDACITLSNDVAVTTCLQAT